MYSAPFEYLRAGSWEEAVALLSEHGEDARAIAGGQSLVPMMMFRLTELSVLVDLADIDAGAIKVA
ncbi:MAG: FAD binding domain-containing protein, partial [Ilumatobacteraceae bacterium]